MTTDSTPRLTLAYAASMRVLFLDVDGVLNRTGYRPAASTGLRSWIEPDLARRLSQVLATTGAVLVMSSDWRRGRELERLRTELSAAGVVGTLHDKTPELGTFRWQEIAAWLEANPVDAYVIVDDMYDMGDLAARFVRTSPLGGLDEDAAARIAQLFA